jgi:hypothetical protein
VAQHGALAAGADRRQPPPLGAQRGVSDRVDADVQPPKGAAPHATVHGGRAEPEAEQLRARHHTVLRVDELREVSAGFGVYMTP